MLITVLGTWRLANGEPNSVSCLHSNVEDREVIIIQSRLKAQKKKENVPVQIIIWQSQDTKHHTN